MAPGRWLHSDRTSERRPLHRWKTMPWPRPTGPRAVARGDSFAETAELASEASVLCSRPSLARVREEREHSWKEEPTPDDRHSQTTMEVADLNTLPRYPTLAP